VRNKLSEIGEEVADTKDDLNADLNSLMSKL
jgi:hypothetical protein